MAEETRVCRDCENEYPITDYHVDSRAPSGRRTQCKWCRSGKMKEWYEANRERQSGRQAQRRVDDIEKIREQDRQRYYRNKPKRLELAKEHTHIRRARMKGGVWERGVTERALRKRDGDKCCYCLKIMSFETIVDHQYNPDRATVEHVVPISKGGDHTMANTRLACWECNIRRGNREGA